MARVWDWLTTAINCQPLIAMLTPEAPVDIHAHLRSLNRKIDNLDEEKTHLVSELQKLRVRHSELLAKKDVGRANIVRAQMGELVKRCKEIDAHNMLLVGQYSELEKVHGETDLLKTSAQTTALMQQQTRQMSKHIRTVGGADGLQSTLDRIADVKQESSELIAAASRALIPDGAIQMRETGVMLPPTSIEEEIDDYLGQLEGDESQAASSVHEPPTPTADPYATGPVLIGT